MINLKNISLAIIVFFGVHSNISAQCDKWGADSVKAMQELSVYKEFYKQDNYKDAFPHWMYVYKKAPGARKFTYVDGVKI